MKTRLITLALALGMACSLLDAQEGGSPADGPRPPPSERGAGGFRAHVLPPGAREKLGLTTQQQQQIAAVEAEVKARLEKILTADQIRELQKMRPPRPRGGPDGEGRPGEDGPPPPPPPGD